MTGNYYIASGKSASETYYISNTYPIIWSSEVSEAKKFITYGTAKMELEDNFITLANTISGTGMKGIFILEFDNNGNQVGRFRFL